MSKPKVTPAQIFIAAMHLSEILKKEIAVAYAMQQEVAKIGKKALKSRFEKTEFDFNTDKLKPLEKTAFEIILKAAEKVENAEITEKQQGAELERSLELH